MRKIIIIVVYVLSIVCINIRDTMVNLTVRCHPDVLFGRSNHHIELILRTENSHEHHVWAEADITVPEGLSVSPHGRLRKGKVRIGIIGKGEFLEKSVRVYSSSITLPKMYKCNIVLYSFNKDGIIENRIEKAVNIRCEVKKEAAI
jgi:hypothetical protein